jgi:glycosyltransferase involved in cell wall biosynthesis
MNILAIYPYSPYPTNNGGRIRGHQILEAMLRDHKVTLIAPGADQDRAAAKQWVLANSLSDASLIVDPDCSKKLSTAGAKLRAAGPSPLWGRPSHMSRRDIPQMWNTIAELPLKEYDIVHVRNLHMAPYALAVCKLYPAKKLVLDLDDVESVVRLRTIHSERLPILSRWRAQSYMDLLRLRLFERTYLRRFDSVWVCSNTDALLLAGWIGTKRSYVVPNVMDTRLFANVRHSPRKLPIVIFVAEFRMKHNADAARFLNDKVWPLVKLAIPHSQLWLVGRDPGPDLLVLDGRNGVTVTGTVPEVNSYLAQASVAVAPLHVGGGTRLKVLEAFAAGIPVVATTVGAEGIMAENGRDILIADNAEEFATHCVRLLTDSAFNERIRESAFALVNREYNLPVLCEKVDRCYRSLFETGQNSTAHASPE